jgi:hypothetical protein
MSRIEPKAVAAIRAIADAIVEAVNVAGDRGAPGGVLYAACMAHGLSLAQFEQFMGALVAAGKLTKRGDLYFGRR